MQDVAHAEQEAAPRLGEPQTAPIDHWEEQAPAAAAPGVSSRSQPAPSSPDEGSAPSEGPYDWMGLGTSGEGGTPSPSAEVPKDTGGSIGAVGATPTQGQPASKDLGKADSPGALLSTLTAAAPSSLLGAYEASRLQAPKLLHAQWDATVQGLPELPTPTGLQTSEKADAPTPVDAEKDGQVVLEAGEGQAPPAQAQIPALAPALKAPSTEIPEGQVAGAAAGALSALRLPTEAVKTRVGARPVMALGGDSDPGRMARAKTDMEGQVGQGRSAAHQASSEDFGESLIAPMPDAERLTAQVELKEPAGLGLPQAPAVALPAELSAQVDGSTAALLQEQFAAPLLEQQVGEQAFEDKKTAAHLQATEQMDQAQAQAIQEQLGAREGASAEVSAARAGWKMQVDTVQSEAQAKATQGHAEQRGAIDAKALEANAQAQGHLDDAEKQAAAHKKEAESKAAQEKAKSQKESGGFLGWVASKAKAFVDGLKASMNDIYDGLRSIVKKVFEAAKKLAEAAIELGRKAIVAIIEGYAALLKGVLRVALAAFPKLAEAACKRIDQAKAKATELVNKAAATLKSVTSGILDFLATTLDKALGLAQSLYNGAFTLIGMVITGQWKEIVQGLKNLAESAGQAPPQFEAAAYEEVLGGDMSQPLSPMEMQLAGLPLPEAAGGGGDLGELAGPPWTSENVGVEQVLSGMELSPELQDSLMEQTGGQGELEFGHSEDAGRSMESILGLDAAQGGGAEVVADDGLSVSERAAAKWTIMKKGVSDWWSKNWPLVLAGGVVGTAAFIGANILSGGAVLAAVPSILAVLGPLFMGLMAVQMGGYVANYVEKGWAGDTQPAGKSLAKALAVGAIELVSYLTFKAGGAALKGAKALAGGAKQLAKGAVNLAKRGVAYVIKQGKVLLKGLSNTAFGKAFKRLGAFGKGLLSKTKFKGFRIRIGGGRFVLQGKINPWVDVASGRIQTLANTSEEIDELVARLKATGKLDSADIAGAKGVSADDLLEEIARRAKLGEMGAKGELAALERRLLENADGVVKNADDLELLREVQKGEDARLSDTGKAKPRKTPDYRSKGADPELVDVKSAIHPPKDWRKWLHSQMKSVNKQIKLSRLHKGRPGGADLQLFGAAAESLRTLDPATVEGFVLSALKGQNSSLKRVTIFLDGKSAFSFLRDGVGGVTRVL